MVNSRASHSVSELRDYALSPFRNIQTSPGASFNEFINCRVHDVYGDSYCHGFYIQSSYNLFSSCEVYSNTGYGIHLYGQTHDDSVHHNVVNWHHP